MWKCNKQRAAINEGMRSELALEQRGQLKWSCATKGREVWRSRTDIAQSNRYYLVGKRVVYRNCIHSACTWIGPCEVSFRICLVKTQTGTKLGVRGHQMLPGKVSSCQTVSVELKQNMWTACERTRKLKKNNRRKKEALTQVPGIWCQKTGTHRDSVFGVACAWSSPLFSEAIHWNKKWSRFLFQALPDARTPVTFRDANLKRLRNPPPCEIHGPPAQVRCR